MNRLLSLVALLSLPAFAQGMLLPTDPSVGPLGIKYQRVSAEIIDGAAVTKVEQVFVNSSNRQLEAHYVFPLPKGAALQDLYLWINGKKTKGEALEQGYPMIHAVRRAAAKHHAPRLIAIVWGKDDHPRIALVGPGISFARGGLAIDRTSVV